MGRKVSVIGAGNVGSSLAELVAYSGLSDVVLLDVLEGVPEGKALDISQACPLQGSSASVIGTSDYGETAGSEAVVITAGLARKPGMSRDDLLQTNAGIVGKVTAEVVAHSPGAVVIVVTNPMDVMAHLALEVSKFPPARVVGMGGVLDSTRFRTFVAREAGVSVRDVEALVLGGHGDRMVPLPRYTTVKGVPVTEVLRKDTIDALIERTRNGGAEIVSLLGTGSAYYAPAAAAYDMLKAVLIDEKRVLPCAAYLRGEYGLSGVYVGVPVVMGAGGVERVMELDLKDEEKRMLEESASHVRALMGKLGDKGRLVKTNG
jgi:malate dehydrogenase